MKVFEGKNFNDIYLDILDSLLMNPENKIKNRKAETLHEIENSMIILEDPHETYAFCRDMDFRYLVGELLFYLKGENKLENINKYSKFWNKISDDGINLNSCYGYYIWNMKTSGETTQFDYCRDQLVKNPESKKAVITIYDSSEHSHKTNDNPCTMYLHLNIRNNKLNMTTVMRSNDIWFGLPYDIPFFTFVQKMMLEELLYWYPNLKLGRYTHMSNSLHMYERNFYQVMSTLEDPKPVFYVPKVTSSFFVSLDEFMKIENEDSRYVKELHPFIEFSFNKLHGGNFRMEEAYVDYSLNYYFELAKNSAKESNCLKKQVGCVIVNEEMKVVSSGHGGRSDRQGKCEECYRKKETFYQDDCNSIHSEQRAIMRAYKLGKNIEGSTIYLTHGPCDQCMKFIIEANIGKVFYDVPYKTDFTRYKGLIEVYHKTERII